MKELLKKYYKILIAIVVVVLLILFFIIYNLTNKKYEENQIEEVNYYDGCFDYFAIGNSITKHPICDFWWTESGMAATSVDKDYFHLVSNYISENNENSNTNAYYFRLWEDENSARTENLSLLDEFLNDGLDLVTIQLSENTFDMTDFDKDMVNLINYVKTKAPHAQIILIDDFWYEEKSKLKQNIAMECNIDFASLSEIKGKADYSTAYGTIVYDDQGFKHIITDDGVMGHPNDDGMQFIADAIIKLIKRR